MKKPILSNRFVQFGIDREINSYHLIWEENPDLETAQNILNEIFEIHLKNPLNWIIDTRILDLQLPELDEWIFLEWLPKLLASGVEMIATIIPEKKYLKLKNTDPIQPYPQYHFSSGFFYHFHDARNWIRKVTAEVSALSA